MPELSFRELTPHMRCYALVGYYLSKWALMESKLNSTVYRALGLTVLQGAIVTHNVQLRDKINIAKSILAMEIFNLKDREAYTKVMKRIATLSTDRNMVAHDPFLPDEKGDGVVFFVIKAKGKIQFPDAVWSISKFDEKAEELTKIHSELSALDALMGRLKIAAALAKQSPNALLGGLGVLGTSAHPSQGLLGWSLPEAPSKDASLVRRPVGRTRVPSRPSSSSTEEEGR